MYGVVFGNGGDDCLISKTNLEKEYVFKLFFFFMKAKEFIKKRKRRYN